MKKFELFSEAVMLIIFAFLVILLMVVVLGLQKAHAQDAPVATFFTTGCTERMGDIHYRIHFGYFSDGAEAFTVQLTNPNGGTAFINTPEHFTTQPGVHDDWYLDAHAEDSGSSFTVTFTGPTVSILTLNTWDTKPCADHQYGEYVPATPEPVLGDCPAWSYDSLAHTLKCLWDLPKAGDWQ